MHYYHAAPLSCFFLSCAIIMHPLCFVFIAGRDRFFLSCAIIMHPLRPRRILSFLVERCYRTYVCLCVFVCVCVRERERVCERVCVCVYGSVHTRTHIHSVAIAPCRFGLNASLGSGWRVEPKQTLDAAHIDREGAAVHFAWLHDRGIA